MLEMIIEKLLYTSAPDIIKTSKTYIDGKLDSETAFAVKPELDRYAIIAGLLVALVIFHQLVMS